MEENVIEAYILRWTKNGDNDYTYHKLGTFRSIKSIVTIWKTIEN